MIIDPKPPKRVELCPLDRLAPYAHNARTHADDQVAKIAASIAEFGWTVPVLVDEGGAVIVGHGRILAARKLGLDKVPVIRLEHLSPEQVRAYRIADNALTELGGWDEDLLAQELHALNGEGFDLALTGFDETEIDRLLAPLDDVGNGVAEEETVPEPPTKAVTRPGDLWLLGPHRLLCGDATDAADVDRLLDGRPADLCFTSPPYGVGLDYGAYEDSFENCRRLLREVAPRIHAALRAGGFCVTNFGDIVSARAINGTDVPSEYPMALEYWPAFTAAGFVLHTRRIWAKPHARVAAPWCASSNRAASDWEHLWTWLKPGGAYLNERREASALGVWDTSRMEGVEIGKETHPAAFPIAIAMLIIDVYSDRDDVVIDPFGGTGTTLIAAERRGRSARLVELDPKYVDVIVGRWQEFTGKAATLDGTDSTFEEIAAGREAAAA